MRLKTLLRPILVRRVRGGSMAPKIRPGQWIVATTLVRNLHPGQVVIIRRGHSELIKRIERIKADQLFVIGDNLDIGNDSRQFGWLDRQTVVARVFHPNIAK